ncbi:MAG: acyl-CoA dehydrogenase [Actinobacteria bacterium]|nr:acyl-CoA dehydrogenase [Actinomycetota bacterium]
MDFTFSADQEALRDTVRAWLADKAPSEYVRAMGDDERGFLDERWAEIVELGWAAILVPEAQGGLGLGMVDAVVVLEEMGRAPFPGPYFSSAIAATLMARALGATDRLEALAAGQERGTVALEEIGVGDPVDAVRTRARRNGAQWVLTGEKPLVLDAHTADWAIVAARTHEGLGSFLLRAPDAEPVPVMDPTRKAARLVLDETPAEPIGPPGDHAALWRAVADDCRIALAAELVGVCEGALEMAVDYAKARVQFDKPIATHQVIQHKIVDMLHKLELGRVGVHFAAWASDVGDPERERAAAIAKSSMAEAAVFVTAENIQVHGAVGFTWDCDAQLFYKRAKQNDVMLGYQGWQRRRVADLVLDPA